MFFEVVSVAVMTKVAGVFLFLLVPPFRRFSLLCMRSLWAILLAIVLTVGMGKLWAIIVRRWGRPEGSP
ncbi:MAG: hypothetical protein A2951_00920 [Candidatus Buchananbacteria bacterium RIFCSPLOWO2_01_FULL_56_15]|uniref:Uncharacterized protein n=2 Tax=Candidatus Buchananiibacteriota TaxID=1817903 RepID=A0A1G1YCV3_9BACT|nr:MAG: hypothetical protein A3J59_01545 [Candidatus Buchananbacteria bacterium RIFCSPHIGHO2_02_FULL_56_16]OGY55385.1 MAG: hypothetical protein A2951_00920 [Candidatus Buchananbacteria bacterium RIFCSPLOWO2_01_FULL_56_15]